MYTNGALVFLSFVLAIYLTVNICNAKINVKKNHTINIPVICVPDNILTICIFCLLNKLETNITIITIKNVI